MELKAQEKGCNPYELQAPTYLWLAGNEGMEQNMEAILYWCFLQLGIPFWGVPIIRMIVYWGLYWGPLTLGNYHIGDAYGSSYEDHHKP